MLVTPILESLCLIRRKHARVALSLKMNALGLKSQKRLISMSGTSKWLTRALSRS